MRRVQVESSNGARQCKTKLTKKIRRIRLLLKSLSYSKQVCMASGNVLQCSKRRSRRSWCSCRLISKACVCMRVHTCVCTCTENTTTTHSTPTEGWRTHASISYNLFCKTFLRAAKIRYSYSQVCFICACARTHQQVTVTRLSQAQDGMRLTLGRLRALSQCGSVQSSSSQMVKMAPKQLRQLQRRKAMHAGLLRSQHL